MAAVTSGAREYITASGYCMPPQDLIDFFNREPTPEELAAVDMSEPDPPEWECCPYCGRGALD